MRAYAACWKPFVVPEAAPLPPWGRIRTPPFRCGKACCSAVTRPARRLCAPWPATPTGGGPCGGACLPARCRPQPDKPPPSLLTSPTWIWTRPGRDASAPAIGRACTTPSTPPPKPRAGILCAGCSSVFPRRSSAWTNVWLCATVFGRTARTAAASTIWRSCCGPAIWPLPFGATCASAFPACVWSGPRVRPSGCRGRS